MAVLVIGLATSPGLAQSSAGQVPSSPTAVPGQTSVWAPVVLDGRILFQVRDSSYLTAEQRATIINRALQEEVQSSETLSVAVIQENGNVVLRGYPSERNLLTVTQQDLVSATAPYSQAITWQRILQNALRQGQLERSSEYVRQATIYSAVVVAIALAIQLFLWGIGRWGSKRIREWLEANHAPPHSWKDSLRIIWKLALLGLGIGLWAAVLLYVTDLFPQVRMARYRLWESLNAQVITIGSSNYSALYLLLLLGLTVGLWFGISTLTRLFRFYILQPAGVNPRIQDVVAILMQYALTFLGMIILLQIWGVDVSSLAIFASVLGVGIGFGIQKLTNNFISGFVITLERPIEVGDFISVGDLMGIVDQIGARSTKLRTLDQVTIIVPNSHFLETEVINWSHGDPVCRMHLSVGLAYGTDLEKAKAALLEAARHHPEVLLRPRPEVWFQGFGDNALKFDLFVWTGDPKRQFKVKSDLYYEIAASLKRYNLQVPFPQRDLHVRSPALETLVQALTQTYVPSTKAPINNEEPADGETAPTVSAMARAKSGELSGGQDSDLSRIAQPKSHQPELYQSAAPRSTKHSSSEELGRSPTDSEVKDLMLALRGENGLPIADRQYRFNLYPRCFTGSELVSWLVQHHNCTREEAMQWGDLLLSQGLMGIVMGDGAVPHAGFQDGYYFYRFRADEEAIAAESQSADSVNSESLDHPPSNDRPSLASPKESHSPAMPTNGHATVGNSNGEMNVAPDDASVPGDRPSPSQAESRTESRPGESSSPEG
jgi:potassium efflux system protein